MGKIITYLSIIFILSGSIHGFAAESSSKGASAKAYEHASDEAVFNRVSDWFATRGKSDEEKKAIIAERKAKREAKRLEKETRKREKAMKNKMKKNKGQIKEKMRKMK